MIGHNPKFRNVNCPFGFWRQSSMDGDITRGKFIRKWRNPGIWLGKNWTNLLNVQPCIFEQKMSRRGLVNSGKDVQLMKSLITPFSILFELQVGCQVPLSYSRKRLGILNFVSSSTCFFFLISFVYSYRNLMLVTSLEVMLHMIDYICPFTEFIWQIYCHFYGCFSLDYIFAVPL